MKKILILLTILALFAAACGAETDTASDATDAASDVDDFATGGDDGDFDRGDAMQDVATDDAGDDAADGEAPADSLGSGGSAQIPDPSELGREIIFTAQIAVGVDDVSAAGAEATQIITDLGGFVFGQNTQGGAEPRSEIVFKVRPEDFAEALDRLGDIGELRNQRITTDDVTERVVDLNSRIEVAELGVERLRTAMENATDLEDFARLEELLLSRESDLEVMRGTLRTLRDQIDLATITLILEQDRVENQVSFVLTVYEGHGDEGALCPGLPVNEIRLDPGDDITLCFENRNLGDQALTDITITETVLGIDGPDDLILVAGDLDDTQPGQSVIQAYETTVERDLFLRATVTAVPTVGDDGEPAGPVVRSQISPQIRVDEDAADPGFSDGFDAAVSLLKRLWVIATVLVGFIIPLLIFVPVLWLVWRLLRRWLRRREADAAQRRDDAARAMAGAGVAGAATSPPPPSGPVASDSDTDTDDQTE